MNITAEQIRAAMRCNSDNHSEMPIDNAIANYLNAELAKQQQPELSDLQRKLVSEGWTAWHGGECPTSNPCEIAFSDGDTWKAKNYDHISWKWDNDGKGGDIIAYRLHKPAWKMPEPPPGKQWHRADFTEEMLPEGYRPLLKEEIQDEEDEWLSNSMGWIKTGEIGATIQSDSFYRTRRPLPVEPKIVPWTRETIPALPFEVRVKRNGNRMTVAAANINDVLLGGSNDNCITYDYLLSAYTRADGSPCGEVQS